MAHTLQLKQSTNVLVDFQSLTTFPVRSFALRRGDGKLAVAALTFDVIGSSNDNLLDNMITLRRTLELAHENFALHERGLVYTPIYLVWKPAGATNTVQTETFGDIEAERTLEGILDDPQLIMLNRLERLTLNLQVRPYLEETAAQSITLSDSTATNNMQVITFSGARGDLDAPLQLTVRTDTANQTVVVAGIKTRGTIANFVPIYEAEAGAAGSGVTSPQVVATFSGGNGVRWAPGALAAEQTIVTWTISANVSDQLGTYRAYIRCNDSAKKISMRLYASSGGADGDYGDNAKQVDTANVETIVDCGVITLPPADTGGNVPASMTIVLKASASAATTFDVDCLYLMPLFEGGYIYAKFPTALGTAGTPDAVLDANDRVARAYLTTFANAQDIRGSAITVIPNRSCALFVLTYRYSNGAHVIATINTLTATVTPRYVLGRGT